MGFTVTPAGRRLATLALLALAVAGALVRAFAPEPSMLRDVGTLLMVLWLPIIGNLVAYLLKKLPRRAPPVLDFPAGAAFTPHLRARVEALDGVSAAAGAGVAGGESRCLLVLGRQAFVARLAVPLAQVLATPGPQSLEVQLLRPELALRALAAGTAFHLVAGTTAVARGSVVEALGPAAA